MLHGFDQLRQDDVGWQLDEQVHVVWQGILSNRDSVVPTDAVREHFQQLRTP
jgi:hypothetical protein